MFSTKAAGDVSYGQDSSKRRYDAMKNKRRGSARRRVRDDLLEAKKLYNSGNAEEGDLDIVDVKPKEFVSIFDIV